MDVCKYSLFSSYSPYYKIQGKIHSHLLQSNAMGITKSFYKEKILKSSVPVSDGKIQGYKRGKGMELLASACIAYYKGLETVTYLIF